jgi:hypothetical protein
MKLTDTLIAQIVTKYMAKGITVGVVYQSGRTDGYAKVRLDGVGQDAPKTLVVLVTSTTTGLLAYGNISLPFTEAELLS